MSWFRKAPQIMQRIIWGPLRLTLMGMIAALSLPVVSYAGDAGLFRTVPVDTPARGILRVSNGSFYAKTQVNSVLADRYAVEHPRLFSNVTGFELGILNSLSLTGSLPYYADLFSQHGRNGHKAGVGDVAAGLRVSFGISDSPWDRISLGARFLIPEQLGYGNEPLGFRTFSSGEFGFGLETAARMRSRFADVYTSASMYQYPRAPKMKNADSRDVFYDTGFGFRGIGKADPNGFAPTIFQNQATISITGIVPVTRRTAAILELGSTSFIEKPRRTNILRLAPGIRFGNADGINPSAGVDFRLKGQAPKTTLLLRLTVPSLSPKDFGRGLGVKKRALPEERIRAKNALVAVKPFTKEDYTYLYAPELREAFQRALGSMDILAVLPNVKTDRALGQEALVPIKDTPQSLGVRLGAHYLISADISSCRSMRTSSFAIPFLISFPETELTLSARTQVTDMITGKVHDMGTITATVVKKRGVIFFPTGPSSDIVQLSVPETRRLERDLINRWVDGFNSRIIERLDLFDWEPKRTRIQGDEIGTPNYELYNSGTSETSG